MIRAKRKRGRHTKAQKRRYFIIDLCWMIANPFLVVLAIAAGGVVGLAWGILIHGITFVIFAFLMIWLGVY